MPAEAQLSVAEGHAVAVPPSRPPPWLTLGHAGGAGGVTQRGHVRGLGRDVGALVAAAQRLHLLQAHHTAVAAGRHLGQAATSSAPHDL